MLYDIGYVCVVLGVSKWGWVGCCCTYAYKHTSPYTSTATHVHAIFNIYLYMCVCVRLSLYLEGGEVLEVVLDVGRVRRRLRGERQLVIGGNRGGDRSVVWY